MVEAEVEFDYEAVNRDELTLTKGDIITNIKMMEGGWWEGEINGKRGMFPDNFVKVIKDLKEKQKPPSTKSKAQTPMANGDATSSAGPDTQDTAKVTKRDGASKKRMMRAKVAYSYNPQNEDELELVVNEMVEVLNQPEEGWWEGIINGKQGMFPSNFVNVIKDADEQDSRPDAPITMSTPTSGGSTPMEEEKPSKTKIKSSGMGYGNIFGNGPPQLRKTQPPAKEVGSTKPEPLPFALKRMSLRKDTASSDKSAVEEKKRAAEKDKERTEDRMDDSQKGTTRVRVIFDYEPKNADELHLKKGDIIIVHDKDAGDSGWWRGELNGKEGVFPDNFTEEMPPEEKSKKKTPAPGPARPPSGPSRPVSGEPKGIPPAKPMIAKQQSQDSLKTTLREPATNGQQRHVPAGARQVLPPPGKRPPLSNKPVAAKPLNKSSDSIDLGKDSTDSRKSDVKEATFDDIKPSSEKLTHLNLSRPKAVGNRRPPSTIGGQGAQVPSHSVENGSVTPGKPKLAPSSSVSSGPSPSPAVASKLDATGPPPRPAAPTSGGDTPAKGTPGMMGAPSSDGSGWAALEQELRKEIKGLHDMIAAIKIEFKKEVKKLMTEVDEEKKHRMMMQVELERIKKLVME